MYSNVKEVFQALGATGAVEWLKENLAITAKPFSEDKLFMCNYSQIDSPKTHPIVMQCRSLIVDEHGNTVSKKFDRFFNLGEAPEITGQVDLTDSIVYNKEDGSLIGVWYNPIEKKWDISTRSMPQGEGEFELPDGSKKTFREMVISTMGWNEHYDESAFQFAFDQIGAQSETYVFEWCHPLNRIVTPYDKPTLYLLDITSEEDGFDSVDHLAYLNSFYSVMQDFVNNVSVIGSFNSNGMGVAEIEERVSQLSDLKEGFVIRCNKTGVRVKVKSKTYVTAHRLRGEFKVPRDKDLLALIQQNEQDEFISYFPEWKERIDNLCMNITFMTSVMASWYAAHSLIEVQKEFALELNATNFPSTARSMLFNVRNRQKTMQQCISELSESQYVAFGEDAKAFTNAINGLGIND